MPKTFITKNQIDEFFRQKKFAIVGVSRNGRKLSNAAYRELKAKGYQLFIVNDQADYIEEERCYKDLKSLPEQVDGVIIFVKPVQTIKVVRDALEAGIKRVWIQKGAESETSIQFCNEQGIDVIYGYCILLFAEPISFFHGIHRWFADLFHTLPK